MSDTTQIPPADELFAVREQLRALTDREKILRALMLVDPSARTGNAYVAEVKKVVVQQPDIKELRKAHPDLVAEYTFPVTREHVELRAITEDGEIVRISRKAKEATTNAQ